MDDQELIEFAISLATDLHAMTTDKQGQPYILHALRVGLAGETTEEKAVGFMHDVFEDTSMELQEVAEMGIPQKIIDALDAITRRDGEPYEDYLDRVAANPIARAVKLHDLKDNIDRLPGLPFRNDQKRLQARYHQAREYLLDGTEDGSAKD